MNNELTDKDYNDAKEKGYLNFSGRRLRNLKIENKELLNIRELSLQGNHFEKIPDCVFDFKQLEVLDVSHNNITKISEKIQELTSLKFLKVTIYKFTLNRAM